MKRSEMKRSERIRHTLTEALHPITLEIVDESARHAGHAGARPEGETHFRLEITSAAFSGKTRVARQRLIHDLLADEFNMGLHALSVKALAPGESGGGSQR